MFVRNAVHNGSVWIHILSVFLATDSEEGGRGAFGPQKTKEDKRGDRGGKTVEDQEERGGGAESLEMVGKCCSFHFASTFTQPQHTHTIKSRLHGGSRAAIFTFSSSCLVSGGRKRSMKMGWNGSSSNTMDPTSLLSTSLFQTTLTSTMVVSWMSERVKWKGWKGFTCILFDTLRLLSATVENLPISSLHFFPLFIFWHFVLLWIMVVDGKETQERQGKRGKGPGLDWTEICRCSPDMFSPEEPLGCLLIHQLQTTNHTEICSIILMMIPSRCCLKKCVIILIFKLSCPPPLMMAGLVVYRRSP